MSSYGSKSAEELRQQTTWTFRVEVGDHVFLKVMLKREVARFGKRGKLALRYIGPFEILERVNIVSYRLVLPPSILGVHEVFHVSMLRKYTPDSAHVVD